MKRLLAALAIAQQAGQVALRHRDAGRSGLPVPFPRLHVIDLAALAEFIHITDIVL